MKQKYKEYCVAPRTVSAAVYDYLEKRGVKVNRKRGIKSCHWIAGEPPFPYVYVMVKV
jgi:hypothetical protein